MADLSHLKTLDQHRDEVGAAWAEQSHSGVLCPACKGDELRWIGYPTQTFYPERDAMCYTCRATFRLIVTRP